MKVDREERPDVDALYMEAVQGMTGRGGWPLNVFLTPEQLPFYGGTYFPPEPRHGMPAWTQVLQAIAESWEREPRGDPRRRRALRERLSGGARLTPSERADARRARWTSAVATLRESLRRAQRRLRRGAEVPAGLGDRVPAGCAASARWRSRRCARWPPAASTTSSAAASPATASTRPGRCPHFEKMLYDNALLARAYLHGWQASRRRAPAARCASDTLDWALREMRGPEGGFYSRARRRLRGRRGPLLRVDASTSCASCSARTPTRRSPGSGAASGQLRRPAPPRAGPERALQDRGPRPPQAERRGAHPRAAAARARERARAARRSTTSA